MRACPIVSLVFLVSLFAFARPIAAQEIKDAPAKAEEKKVQLPEFKQPVFVTDIGQGNTARLIEVMLRRGGDKIKFDSKPLGTVKDLGEAKTLLIGVGGSTKGLGAAGLDATVETERMKALIETAKKAEISIIGVHMGGMPRRGELSDAFNRYVFEQSNLFILWKGGNEDGFFTRLEKEKKEASAAPLLVTVENKPDVGQKLLSYLAPKADEGKKAEAKPETKADEKAGKKAEEKADKTSEDKADKPEKKADDK